MSLDGYFEGAKKGDIGWHKHLKGEQTEYAEKMSQTGNTLLFGRVTYEMMASYWPTPFAKENDPITADGMNKSEKIVFSRTLKKADWNNTELIKGDLIGEVKKLKKMQRRDMTLLGSGSILTRLAEHGLIDEYQFMLDPVVIGKGKSIFNGIGHQLDLKLESVRTFKSGIVLLNYRPV